MRHLFFTFFLIVFFQIKASGQYTLTGSVTGDDYLPALGAHVTISLGGEEKNTATDGAGKFRFVLTQAGEYTLRISSLGFDTHEEVLSILPAQYSYALEITLSTVSKELQTIEVLGRTVKKYHSDYSFSATKTAILNKELPQSISSITKELIADRQAFQLADAVKIVSGVAPSSFYNQYAIRGISQNEEGQIINGMRTRQFYFLQPLTSHIERVEVLKGPASVTFSSVDPGGSINMVTKKPLTQNRKEISLSAGSFSTIRGALDFTGPLNESKTLLYRLNGAYQEAQSYRDLVKNNSFLLSPSFSYIPNDRTAVNVEMIVSNMNGNLDRGQPIFGATAGLTNLNSTPISQNLGTSNDFFKSKELILMGSLTHQFSDRISFNASYMKQTWQEDLQEHRTTNAFAVDIENKPVTSLAGMQFVQRKQLWNIDNLNAFFNLKSARGKVKNNVLIGYDLSAWHKIKGGGQNAARGFLLKNGGVASSFVAANVDNYQTIQVGDRILPRPNVAYFDLNNPVYTIRNISDYTLNSRIAVPSALTTTHAVYLQDHFVFGKAALLLSLRQEWFEDITGYKTSSELSFDNSALLPRIGLTYAISDAVNVYGTYLRGYQPQSNTVTLMPSTGAFFWAANSAAQFKPLESDLKEIGAKVDLFGRKMQLTTALYEINQKNILMSANDPANPDLLVQRGADRSRGFEVDIAGFLTPNWQINAAYSYIDAVIVTDLNEALNGERKENTPVNSANVWTRYNFKEQSPLRNIGIGLGVQYSGDRIPWFTRAFTVPAYTLVDIAFYYTPAGSKVQIALNMNNVFNQTYWIGAQNYLRLFPGAPRNLMLTATYRF